MKDGVLPASFPRATFRRPWLAPHLVGLDVAAIAVLWHGVSARAVGLSADFKISLVLFFSVWGIYLLDRVWDGRRDDPSAFPSRRHTFSREHGRTLATLGTICLIVAAGFALQALPVGTLLAGAGVALLCLGYYAARVRFRTAECHAYRAIALGTIFFLGVSFPAVIATGWSGLPVLVGGIGLFSANAFECMLAETRLGGSGSGANSLLIPAFVAVAASTAFHGPPALAVSTLALGAVSIGRRHLAPDTHGALADAALLAPLLVAPGISF